MLDTIRELARQLKYQKAIIDALIPVQELQAIEHCLEWSVSFFCSLACGDFPCLSLSLSLSALCVSLWLCLSVFLFVSVCRDQELDDWVLVRPVVSTIQRELKLKDLIIDSFIPPSEVQKVLKRAEWDAEHGEYRIARIEMSGNRMYVILMLIERPFLRSYSSFLLFLAFVPFPVWNH